MARRLPRRLLPMMCGATRSGPGRSGPGPVSRCGISRPNLYCPHPVAGCSFSPGRLTDGCGVRVALFRLGQGADEGPIDALTSNGLEARYSR